MMFLQKFVLKGCVLIKTIAERAFIQHSKLNPILQHLIKYTTHKVFLQQLHFIGGRGIMHFMSCDFYVL